MFSSAQCESAPSVRVSVRPSGVRSYSTVTGTVGNAVRVTSPSRSRSLRARDRTLADRPPIDLFSALNRSGPITSRRTTSTVHLSPMRSRIGAGCSPDVRARISAHVLLLSALRPEKLWGNTARSHHRRTINPKDRLSCPKSRISADQSLYWIKLALCSS